ncbi:MAG TPA: GNAT family N-acetyltransferase [Polyangiaceae bacterium]|nr:GNAT family N-acetyltransferase [Polyangiaceae bacterium]
MSRSFVVRPVQPADLPAVGRLAGQLVRYHYALDPRRFMLIDRVEEGYAHFLGREASNPRAVVLCAAEEPSGEIVGYAYGTLEGRDWNALLDPHGALHDVLVDPGVRRAGLGARLVLETCRRLEALGAPRVLLHTAVQNEAAQALFSKLGFRSTMIEMTRERGGT